MATVTLAKQFTKQIDVDGSLKNRAWDFLRKVMSDPTAPGLHIEPIVGSRDSRVRTGRINDGYRAVMFLVDEDPEPAYVLAAIAAHDDANALAERLVLRTNPVNGVVELLNEPAEPAEPVIESPTPSARRQDEEHRGPLGTYTVAELEAAGISGTLAERAIAAPSEDVLLTVLDDAPSWQADVLLAVALGTSIDDALQNLEVEPGAAPKNVADALQRPGSQMEFVRVDSDDELRRVLEGSFEAWRTFLHPEQRKWAYRDRYNGAFRLSGGAGTGKTVVAIHRARHLAQPPGSRGVLTTYTTTLSDSLGRDLRSLDAGVRQPSALGSDGVVVRGVDKLAREALDVVDPSVFETVAPQLLRSGGRGLTMLGDVEDRALWQEVIDESDTTPLGDLARSGFLLSEYRTVVLPSSIETAADYARIPRPGRGTRLGRAQRMAVWKLIETYRRKLVMRRAVSFPELASIAGAALEEHAQRTGKRLADHVVVDEAQDLNAGHWRLLRALVPEGPNDLFICEDSHQRIYGERLVLSRFGIAIRGRSRSLTLNYRTTAQNLGFAVRLLEGVDVRDLEGEQESTSRYRSALSGPVPRLVPCESLSDELDTVAEMVRQWVKETDEPHTIGILLRSAGARDRMQRGLADRGVQVQTVVGKGFSAGSMPQVMTMHRAKGLEFERVLLASVDESQLPSRWALGDMPDDEQDDVANRERFLLYVAATRARSELVVTWHGRPSSFLPSADS